MKILVVSDTHGRCKNLEYVLKRTKPIDMLLHLGDVLGDSNYIQELSGCRTEIIAGNNDLFSGLDREKLFQIGKYTVWMTHGHRYTIDDLREEAVWCNADIVLFGHTHIPLIDHKGTTFFVNPGSLSQPRQDGRKPSFIIMELDRKGEVHFSLNYIDTGT